MIAEGEEAPDFTLDDQHGNPVSLTDLRGGTVVLYFYPRANTSGCTTQACGIRDRKAEYEAAGATVIGVSPDPVAEIARFDQEHGFDFTLLADPDHEVAEAYGTWVEKSMYGKKYLGPARAAYLFGADGKLIGLVPKVEAATHGQQLLATIAALK